MADRDNIPQSPGPGIDPLAEAARALTEQLRQENEALEARRFADVAAMQARKAQLGARLERELARANPAPGAAETTFRKVSEGAREAVRLFHRELTENGRILLKFKSISEGIVQSISEEAARRQPGVTRYGADAVIAGKAEKGAPPLALNEVI